MSPRLAPCPERQRLFDEFKAAHRVLVRIHQAELDALLADDLTTFKRAESELAEARKQRDETAERLLRHMREHRC